MNNKWDFLLSKFRSLGGIAENVCQKEGTLGRGIFSINPKLRSRIFTPSQLMIKKEDICLEDNHLRIKKDKEYSQEVIEFFNYYQDNFSWLRGGKQTTESFEQGLTLLSSDLKQLIKKNFLVDIEERHKGDWKNILRNQFLNARAFNFGQDSFIVPVLELVNHEVNAFPFIKRFDGICTPNYPPRDSELTHVYGYISSIKRVLNYGFFCKEPIVFSLPFTINFKDYKLICKGLDLKDDNVKYKFNDSQLVIDGIPIASMNQPSFVENYYKHLCDITNSQNLSKEIFSKMISFNYLRRQELLAHLKPLEHDSCRMLSKAITYELDLISQV